MLKRVFSKLENPKRPLLGPNVKALEFWGILLSDKLLFKYFHLFIACYLLVFNITQYVRAWHIKSDRNLFINDLKFLIIFSNILFKRFFFLCCQNTWKNIIEYVTRADLNQRMTDDSTKIEIIKNYTAHCRKLTLTLCLNVSVGGAITMLYMAIFQPVFVHVWSPYRDNIANGTKVYIDVISSWVPFDTNTLTGYLSASVYRCIAIIYACGVNSLFDSFVLVIMVFFKLELKFLRIDSANIFGTEGKPVSEEVVMNRIKDCHRRHVELCKFASLFNSCLSPVMCFNILLYSIMFCAMAYQITVETNSFQRWITVDFLIFFLLQLFLYCWYSNEVLFASQHLMLGPYESIWWASNLKFRKDVIILTAQFRKPIVFSAGPFTNLSLETFINIVKGAYSYYTLLSQSLN